MGLEIYIFVENILEYNYYRLVGVNSTKYSENVMRMLGTAM